MFYIKYVLNFKCLTLSTKGSAHSNSVITGGRDFEQKFTRDWNRGSSG